MWAVLWLNLVMEIFIQFLSYIGFPKILNAIEVAKKVFSERGVSVDLDQSNK